jgi:hypothetical protein
MLYGCAAQAPPRASSASNVARVPQPGQGPAKLRSCQFAPQLRHDLPPMRSSGPPLTESLPERRPAHPGARRAPDPGPAAPQTHPKGASRRKGGSISQTPEVPPSDFADSHRSYLSPKGPSPQVQIPSPPSPGRLAPLRPIPPILPPAPSLNSHRVGSPMQGSNSVLPPGRQSVPQGYPHEGFTAQLGRADHVLVAVAIPEAHDAGGAPPRIEPATSHPCLSKHGDWSSGSAAVRPSIPRPSKPSQVWWKTIRRRQSGMHDYGRGGRLELDNPCQLHARHLKSV